MEMKKQWTQGSASLLQESYLQLTTTLANRQILKTEILPKAKKVIDGVEAHYAAGDISLAEDLPVRRDGATLQLAYLESLFEVMQAWSQVRNYANLEDPAQ